eukprot:1407983-Prymnesium_polylepis.1
MDGDDGVDEPELVALGDPGARAPAAKRLPPVGDAAQRAAVADECAACSAHDKRAECRLAVLAVLEGELTTLDLSEMGLDSLPQSVESIAPAVLALDLSCNGLSSLPPPVPALTGLVELQLFGNQLTALPDAIGALSSLQRLFVVQNQLACLPAAIGQLRALEVVDVEDNSLVELPVELATLPRLATVRADGNPLQRPSLDVVRRGIDALCYALQGGDT